MNEYPIDERILHSVVIAVITGGVALMIHLKGYGYLSKEDSKE